MFLILKFEAKIRQEAQENYLQSSRNNTFASGVWSSVNSANYCDVQRGYIVSEIAHTYS